MNQYKDKFLEYAQSGQLKHTTYVRCNGDDLYYIDPWYQTVMYRLSNRWVGLKINRERRRVGSGCGLDYTRLSVGTVICSTDLDEVANWDPALDDWRKCPHCAHAMQYQLTRVIRDVFSCPICQFTVERCHDQ